MTIGYRPLVQYIEPALASAAGLLQQRQEVLELDGRERDRERLMSAIAGDAENERSIRARTSEHVQRAAFLRRNDANLDRLLRSPRV